MVYLKSVVSGHKHIFIKPRLTTEKIESWQWDPYSKFRFFYSFLAYTCTCYTQKISDLNIRLF